jgi:hypothetical protein
MGEISALAGAGDYYDVDANDYGVPAGATGVWVSCDNNYASAVYSYYIRKNGSSDQRYNDMNASCHCQVFVGIDANGVFEAKVENTTRIDIYVMGYMTSPVTMLTDAADKSTATTSSYVDVDLSAYSGATMALLRVTASTVYGLYTRKNGSTDDRIDDADAQENNTPGQLVGLDGSQLFEQKIDGTSADLYVVGYYAGTKVTMHTNATDRSTSTTGSYEDVAALAAGALVGFYEIVDTSSTEYSFALRKNGEAEDPYADCYDDARQCWIVECDGDRVVEQKIENAAVDCWEMGYAIAEVTGWAHTFCGVTSPAEAIGVAAASLDEVVGV